MTISTQQLISIINQRQKLQAIQDLIDDMRANTQGGPRRVYGKFIIAVTVGQESIIDSINWCQTNVGDIGDTWEISYTPMATGSSSLFMFASKSHAAWFRLSI